MSKFHAQNLFGYLNNQNYLETVKEPESKQIEGLEVHCHEYGALLLTSTEHTSIQQSIRSFRISISGCEARISLGR